jgi:hypothetical protein
VKHSTAIVPRLREEVDAATNSLAEIFATSFRKRFGDFELHEVEIELSVSADGTLGVMGSGVSVTGGGYIKMKFVHRAAALHAP